MKRCDVVSTRFLINLKQDDAAKDFSVSCLGKNADFIFWCVALLSEDYEKVALNNAISLLNRNSVFKYTSLIVWAR